MVGVFREGEEFLVGGVRQDIVGHVLEDTAGTGTTSIRAIAHSESENAKTTPRLLPPSAPATAVVPSVPTRSSISAFVPASRASSSAVSVIPQLTSPSA